MLGFAPSKCSRFCINNLCIDASTSPVSSYHVIRFGFSPQNLVEILPFGDSIISKWNYQQILCETQLPLKFVSILKWSLYLLRENQRCFYRTAPADGFIYGWISYLVWNLIDEQKMHHIVDSFAHRVLWSICHFWQIEFGIVALSVAMDLVCDAVIRIFQLFGALRWKWHFDDGLYDLHIVA